MKIVLTSILVDDQEKALQFYTKMLGFQKKTTAVFADTCGNLVQIAQKP
jgi:catechol 2,3-dioxygenase-like lactoylglutathione lyase family enzyme